MMIKRLKNISPIDRTLFGIPLPKNEYVDLPIQVHRVIASEPTAYATEVSSGSFIVNNGTEDLSASQGLIYLQAISDAQETTFSQTGWLSKNVHDAIIEANQPSGSGYVENRWANSPALSSTNLNSWQTKLTLSAEITGGSYIVIANALYSNEAKAKLSYIRLAVDANYYDQAAMGLSNNSYSDGCWFPFVQMQTMVLTPGTHSVRLQYHASGGKYMYIKETTLWMQKIGA